MCAACRLLNAEMNSENENWKNFQPFWLRFSNAQPSATNSNRKRELCINLRMCVWSVGAPIHAHIYNMLHEHKTHSKWNETSLNCNFVSVEHSVYTPYRSIHIMWLSISTMFSFTRAYIFSCRRVVDIWIWMYCFFESILPFLPFLSFCPSSSRLTDSTAKSEGLKTFFVSIYLRKWVFITSFASKYFSVLLFFSVLFGLMSTIRLKQTKIYWHLPNGFFFCFRQSGVIENFYWLRSAWYKVFEFTST